MQKLLSDENFNGHVIDGLRLHHPEIDLVRVQDVGLAAADDPAILAWAAKEGRVLLTHDITTIPDFVKARIDAGLPMAGVCICIFTARMSAARVIEGIAIAASCMSEDEWRNTTVHVPL